MQNHFTGLGKAFSLSVINRAIQTFDRSTAIIVGCCWSGALLIMLFTIYTLNLSVSSKRSEIEAAASEPSLPVVASKPLDTSEAQPIVDKLKKRFPEISFTLGTDKTLTVTTNDLSKFRLWLTVISYIDTISPQYRWSMKELCVGLKCERSTPMRAVLVAEKVTFKAPAIDNDD